MIISKTPLRVSFAGGGSDINTYYSKARGSVISTTISQFVYICVNKTLSSDIKLSYSSKEIVKNLADVQHDLFRETLRYFDVNSNVEITSISDIPGKGSGLGSSSAFLVGLINALSCFCGIQMSPSELARVACEIEIDICRTPAGKQDQYAAAFGGFNCFGFNQNNTVDVEKLHLSKKMIDDLESSILIINTGVVRSSSSVLRKQHENVSNLSGFSAVNRIVGLADSMKSAIIRGDLHEVAALLDEGWHLKKQLSDNVTNETIEHIYKTGIENGALGGKLLGAGNGGYVLFLAEKKYHQDITNSLADYSVLPCKFHFDGSEIIYS